MEENDQTSDQISQIAAVYEADNSVDIMTLTTKVIDEGLSMLDAYKAARQPAEAMPLIPDVEEVREPITKDTLAQRTRDVLERNNPNYQPETARESKGIYGPEALRAAMAKRLNRE